MRVVALAAVVAGVGTTLVLAELRWFHRLPLVERLRPFSPGGRRRAVGLGGGPVDIRGLLLPYAGAVGRRLSLSLGINDDLTVRLIRVHSDDDVTSFRMRQIGWSVSGLILGVVIAVVGGLPGIAALLVIAALPTLGFLVPEQRLTAASDSHRERLALELPVITEQFGMLLSSGYSLTGALTRIADRTAGAAALDLERVVRRIRHGIAPIAALREWVVTVDIPSVDQLVAILALHEDTNDLGRLISNEARTMRRDLQRRLLERIEKRSQQVWIPVTVAALVPGVIFLAIPFTSALQSFGSL